MRHISLGCDETDHEFSCPDADAAHDVADDARVGLLVIGRHAIVVHPLADDAQNVVVASLLNGARRDLNDPVAAGGIAADDGFPLCSRCGELHLVAVFPRRRCAQGWKDVYSRQMADAFQGVPYLPLFFQQLAVVAHVLELAAAALGVYGTLGLHALRRRRDDVLQYSRGVLLFDDVDFGLHRFTGQRPSDKDRKVFIPPYAFAAGAEAEYINRIYISFCNRNRPVLFHEFLPFALRRAALVLRNDFADNGFYIFRLLGLHDNVRRNLLGNGGHVGVSLAV